MGIVIATHYDLGISDSVYPEKIGGCQCYRHSLSIQLLGALTYDGPYYNSRFRELNQISVPRNTNPILKILLSLKLIAGCDRGFVVFLKSASGCSTDRLVEV